MTQEYKKKPKNKMILFKVIDIISFNTIKTQGWVFKEVRGSKVQVRGIDLDNRNKSNDEISDLLKNRLETLLKDKEVVLKSAEWVTEENSKDPIITVSYTHLTLPTTPYV